MSETPSTAGFEHSIISLPSLEQVVVAGAAVLFLLWAAKKTYEGILGKKHS